MTQGHSRERLVEAVADHEYSPWGSHWCSCGWSPDAPSYGMAREHAHHVLDVLLSLTDDSGVPEVVNVALGIDMVPSLIETLHQADGVLGLALHRRENCHDPETWNPDAEDAIRRLRAHAKALESRLRQEGD